MHLIPRNGLDYCLFRQVCGRCSRLTRRQLRGVDVHLHSRFECELDEVLVQST